MIRGYTYAGVQDGGKCSCGYVFGRHGEANNDDCYLNCDDGWGEQNCGGELENAIYNTELRK